MTTKGTTTKETSIINGIKNTIHNTRIVTTWNQWSKFKKITVVFYIGTVLGTFGTSCYIDGKRGLLKHREEVVSYNGIDTKNKQSIFKNEYDAVWNNINGYKNFWESLFFPWTLISNAMPWLVIKLNPPEPPRSFELNNENWYNNKYSNDVINNRDVLKESNELQK